MSFLHLPLAFAVLQRHSWNFMMCAVLLRRRTARPNQDFFFSFFLCASYFLLFEKFMSAPVPSASSSPIPRFDLNLDPQVGDWVLVIPPRWSAVMGDATPPGLKDEIKYVNLSTGAVLEASSPPLEFGGSDFVECVDESGRRVFVNRTNPSDVRTDPRVLLPQPVPQWVEELEGHFDAVVEALGDVAERETARKRRRQELALRGLDPEIGTGPWSALRAVGSTAVDSTG